MRGFAAIALAVLLAVAGPSSAQMTLTGAGSTKKVASAPSFSLTFESEAQAASGTIVNYGTMTYGSGCTRVVAGNLFYSTGITGITIGGVALAQVSGAFVAASPLAADVWESTSALSGSSGAVQVTYAAGISFNSTIALYCLVTTTPTGTATVGASIPNSTAAVSPTVPSGGGAVVITGSSNGTAISTLSNSTIDKTDTTSGINQTYGHTTATGSITVTATYGGSDLLVLSVVSWSP